MNLQQDLDEFQYHAPETLHAGIFGEDHLNPRVHTDSKLKYLRLSQRNLIPEESMIEWNKHRGRRI